MIRLHGPRHVCKIAHEIPTRQLKNMQHPAVKQKFLLAFARLCAGIEGCTRLERGIVIRLRQ